MASNETPRQWLQRTAKRGARWTRLSVIAGTLSTLILLVQAWCIATIAQRMVIDSADFSSLVTPLLLLPPAFIARGLLVRARTIFGARGGIEIRQSVRRELLERIAILGPLWARRQHSATLSNRVWDQVDALQGFYADYRPQMLLCGIIPVIIVIAVAPLSWAAALILIATGPLIPMNMAMVGLGAKKRQEDQFLEMGRMSRHFLDTLQGLSTLKLFDVSKRQAQEVHTVSEGFRRRTMRVLRLAFLSSTVLEFFASVSIALLALYLGFVYLGQFHFGMYDHGINLFIGLFILILAPEFYQPLRDLGVHYHARAEAEAAAEDLIPILNRRVFERDTEQGAWQPEGSLALSLQGLTARYAGRSSAALDNVTIDIRANEMLAVIGPSGAGKSTLLNILMGFMHFEAGSVSVMDGSQPPRALADIRPDDWQHQIAWVGQSAVIVSGTLADNLRLANAQASDDDLLDALEQAALHHWFTELPEGLETRLGEGGRAVSGGQARRIALARAFLRDARLVLLDEPTASLDQASERLVMETLTRLCRGRTVILLTHRMELLALADRVLMLDQGHVQALDTLDALRAPGGPLARPTAIDMSEMRDV
ncbi:thiol reductant ABC exporter subunit CydD [Kushneria pakistanensis]|uniref:Thiol reductant ABC exporter subunit CydD n=1 Tax=Kushneria pakistanensis TaxID=1508770 RepID=A0ABQ3FC83_9GAMM|nr:thiol reductant ABC exporter subunit CydD [Kushneria pakistanensis]GHC17780.1 thiol reductant ABC exporter subunit CydD [Kushneria pakistanensis]